MCETCHIGSIDRTNKLLPCNTAQPIPNPLLLLFFLTSHFCREQLGSQEWLTKRASFP
jgi:hypothetical protein